MIADWLGAAGIGSSMRTAPIAGGANEPLPMPATEIRFSEQAIAAYAHALAFARIARAETGATEAEGNVTKSQNELHGLEGPLQARQQPKEAALARSRGADQAQHLAGHRLQPIDVQHLSLAVAECQAQGPVESVLAHGWCLP